ncbi:thioesterase family protein [Mesorhizobium sp. M0522]|uniref:thioesterase family protein n=1 Tax=Mesorhizobium sp. M0522 TaxID=2956958 RepID=UPI00333509A3
MVQIRKAACVGGGVIGGGWIARFCLAGIDVKVYDPHPEARRECLSWPLSKLTDVVNLDDQLVEKIASQSDAQSERHSIRQLERIRHQNLVGILQALKVGDEGRGWGAGKLLADFEKHLWSVARPPQASPSPATLKLFEVKVAPAWVDYNGHMTEYRYSQCFADASDVILRLIGVDMAYVKAGRSYYTVEGHVRLLAEAKLGDALYIKAQFLPSDGKKIHTFMSLYRASDDNVLATCEHLMLHVSSKEGRSVTPPAEILSRLIPFIGAHADLPAPEGKGRFVGEKPARAQ